MTRRVACEGLPAYFRRNARRVLYALAATAALALLVLEPLEPGATLYAVLATLLASAAAWLVSRAGCGRAAR